MKRSRLDYSSWKCISGSAYRGTESDIDGMPCHVGLLEVKEVSEPYIWHFAGREINICDRGLKWLSILPKEAGYCIGALLDEKDSIVFWYIDMISGWGTDPDGVPWFDDLYLDLIVFPDGTVLEDDMDELEDARNNGDITEAMFAVAVETAEKLKSGLLADISAFADVTKRMNNLFNDRNQLL